MLPSFEAPAAELLPALQAAGLRFLHFVHTVLATEEGFQARSADLEVWAEESASALRSWSAGETEPGPDLPHQTPRDG